jgi:hypothetical protein
MSFNTPILFITFNRLDTVVKVFDRIKEQKPRYFYWASDGPRFNKPDEVQKVRAVKEYIFSQIDWNCEVKTLFREENMGCGLGVSTAITWFFNNVEQGIILEDDCLPLPGFFEFCEELLNYYKDDQQVFEISGTNLQAGKIRGDGSYYFSNYGGIWGWATWARAWKNYDFKMLAFDEFVKGKKIERLFTDKKQQLFWINAFKEGKNVDTWDYQWVFTFWNNNGICIVPNKNLISNIGFNNEGTHTFNEPVWYKKLIGNCNNIIFPIKHPASKKILKKADDFLFNQTMNTSVMSKLKSAIKRIIKKH